MATGSRYATILSSSRAVTCLHQDTRYPVISHMLLPMIVSTSSRQRGNLDSE